MAYQLLTLWSVKSDASENEHFQTWTQSSLIIAKAGTLSTELQYHENGGKLKWILDLSIAAYTSYYVVDKGMT